MRNNPSFDFPVWTHATPGHAVADLHARIIEFAVERNRGLTWNFVFGGVQMGLVTNPSDRQPGNGLIGARLYVPGTLDLGLSFDYSGIFDKVFDSFKDESSTLERARELARVVRMDTLVAVSTAGLTDEAFFDEDLTTLSEKVKAYMNYVAVLVYFEMARRRFSAAQPDHKPPKPDKFADVDIVGGINAWVDVLEREVPDSIKLANEAFISLTSGATAGERQAAVEVLTRTSLALAASS